jgi:NitT/TauT family transport system permease protein
LKPAVAATSLGADLTANPTKTGASAWASAGPVALVLLGVLVAWYLGAIALNSTQVLERFKRDSIAYSTVDLVQATWSQTRPLLPAPHQVAADLVQTIFKEDIRTPQSLLFHAGVTSITTLTGFVLGAMLGIVLAVLIVHFRTLERGLLPWIIASQAVPILAIAPIVIVIFGNLGFSGWAPKAFISMYLCFFPVTVAMVQGLRSAGVFERELLYTYAATPTQGFWRLRLPASLPFLMPSLRVGVSAGLVGAIVAELPTGAQAGLGARLLAGSYYGNTAQIWSALLMAACLGLALNALMQALENWVLRPWRVAPK